MNYTQVQKQPYTSHLLESIPPQIPVAIIFVSLYLLEAWYGPTIKSLWDLQQNDLYKQVSGFALLTYVLYQWRLARLRMSGEKINQNFELNLHMWLGVFTPMVLYLHSSQMGYGYQALLAGLFLFNVLFGLCSPKLLKIRHKRYVVAWLVVHSGIAMLVPVLLIYHIYVIYFYE